MKKALSCMMIGALATATVCMLVNNSKTVNDLKRKKEQVVGKFKAMF